MPNTCVVEGYATTFDVPYDFGYDGYREVVHFNAFDSTDMTDVIFQLNHDGMVMARTRNSTLQLARDEHGLYVRADLSGCSAGRELYEGIQNGLIDRMSWGFIVEDGDGYTYERDQSLFHVNKVRKVFDVSAVSIPADEDTFIKARSLIDGVIEEELARQEVARCRVEEMQRRRRAAALLGITV